MNLIGFEKLCWENVSATVMLEVRTKLNKLTKKTALDYWFVISIISS